MHETMLDSKVMMAVSDKKSSLVCTACMEPVSKLNEYDFNRPPPSIARLKKCCSALHCWINSFTFIPHIGQRLNVKKWRITEAEDKIEVKKQHTRMQHELRDKLNVSYDVPNPRGGNSNTGKRNQKLNLIAKKLLLR